VVPGQMGCESAVGIKCWESGGPKGTGRLHFGPEAAGPGKTAPGLEPEISLEVPNVERFTPILVPFRSEVSQSLLTGVLPKYPDNVKVGCAIPSAP
jgi:hypothetical protein